MLIEVAQQNAFALEPLFKSWEEPTLHRLPNLLRDASERAWAHASGRRDRMHAPSKGLLPFRRVPLVGFATGRLPTALGAYDDRTPWGRLPIMTTSFVAVRIQRLRESRTSHRRSDADDDGSARR